MEVAMVAIFMLMTPWHFAILRRAMMVHISKNQLSIVRPARVILSRP
jgi:hypothetical protein